MTASIEGLLSEEFLSQLNPFLLQGEVVAAAAVGLGILWESETYKGDEIKKLAFWLVMLGSYLKQSSAYFCSRLRDALVHYQKIKQSH